MDDSWAASDYFIVGASGLLTSPPLTEAKMETVICGTSMTSAINVVLNLGCLWLLFIVMADLRKIKDRQNGERTIGF